MPIYEYECRVCGSHFDMLQKFGDPRPATCPNGHTDVHRLLSQPAIIFKGSGFYVTDNGRNGHRDFRRAENKPDVKETSAGETEKAHESEA